MTEAVVVGGGISGISCAAALAAAGMSVRVRDRGRRLAGRMSSRALRDTGTGLDGRVVDIGASYFTAAHADFVDQVSLLIEAGVVRPWTDTFHVAGPDGIVGVKSGPLRYSAPLGLRSVVEALVVEGVEVSLADEVSSIEIDSGGVRVDGVAAGAVAVCMPDPQARRLGSHLPERRVTWEPVIAVTCVFGERTWPQIDGVFVNDEPVLTWIADDGRRRGDDAPVLVAHVNPVLAARHLEEPAAVIPAAVAALQRVLGIGELPKWVDAHRWTYAKPLAASDDPYWLHERSPVGLAGDAWAGGPRVEAAWLSGRLLGQALAARAGGG